MVMVKAVREDWGHRVTAGADASEIRWFAGLLVDPAEVGVRYLSLQGNMRILSQ